jgi:hypothetical protein
MKKNVISVCFGMESGPPFFSWAPENKNKHRRLVKQLAHQAKLWHVAITSGGGIWLLDGLSRWAVRHGGFHCKNIYIAFPGPNQGVMKLGRTWAQDLVTVNRARQVIEASLMEN